jgi:tRNA (guanine-N7-)-methyltransferase
VRKLRRLPAEVLAPYQWAPPGGFRYRWGMGKPDTTGAMVGSPDPTTPTTDALPQVAGSGDPATAHSPISWPDLFGNDHPVEIEVGFGKGMFLIAAATANAGRNFFGIEIVRKYQLYATTRIVGRKLPNVKTCCGDAKVVFRDYIAPGSVAAVHVYFPDPWWKTRHRKRLLFTSEFADLVHRVLQPGGLLHFATDVGDYFAMVTDLLNEKLAFVPVPPPAERTPEHDLDYMTNFERKFRKQGKAIYRSEYQV